MGNYHARFYEGLGRGDTPSLLSSGNNSQFTFDGYGKNVQIVEITSGTISSTKQFVWCGSRRCEARSATGALTSQFFSKGQTISGNKYYFTKDQLRSIRECTNGSGSVQTQYSYDPYGSLTKIISGTDSDFQYAGYYSHARSGSNLTRNRVYSAILGRWINRDPIGERGGLNLTSYVGNKPIRFRDPSGLVTITIPPGQGPLTGFPWLQPEPPSPPPAPPDITPPINGYPPLDPPSPPTPFPPLTPDPNNGVHCSDPPVYGPPSPPPPGEPGGSGPGAPNGPPSPPGPGEPGGPGGPSTDPPAPPLPGDGPGGSNEDPGSINDPEDPFYGIGHDEGLRQFLEWLFGLDDPPSM